MKHKRIFFWLFSLIILMSCQKEPVKCPDPYIAPTDFTAYWRFPTGSKWIYKLDTSIDIYDTVTGTSRIDFGNDNPDGGPCDYRIYEQHYQHSNLKYFLPSYPTSNHSSEWLHLQPDNILTHYSNSRSLFPYHQLIKYPFNTGDSIKSSRPAIKVLTAIDTFTSAIGTFDSTIHLISTPPIPYLNLKHFTDMYLVKNVGIVKLKYTNGEVWNLVAYEIKK